MATPRNNSYSAASGGAIYAGIAPPLSLPTWLSAIAVGQWGAIAGTSGAAGARLNAFSGLGKQGTKWVSACAGGHGDGLDNRVVSIDLSANAPAWSVLKAASASGTNDVNYYSDGKPASRHTYHSIFGISGNRVMLPGLRFTYNGSLVADVVDAFDLDDSQWVGVVPDSPGTSGSGLANVSPTGYYPVAQDGNGDLWCILHSNGNVAKYTVATNTWSQPSMSSQVSPNVRYPWAWDSTRGQFFGLAWGDGEGFGTGMRAVRMTATTQTAITFNSSAALTQFLADQPVYAGMDYDAINDRFLFYGGSVAGRVYVITPNSGTTWDMSLLSAGGSALPAPNLLVKKLAFFSLGGGGAGIACLPDANSNIYFLRLA